MEITKQTLKKIIKEEILSVLSEEDASELSSEDKEMVKHLESLMLNTDIDFRTQGVEMMNSLLEVGDPVGLYVKENVFDKMMEIDLEYVLSFKGNIKRFYEKDETGGTPFGNLMELYPEILSGASEQNWLKRRVEKFGSPQNFTARQGGRAAWSSVKYWLQDKIKNGE